MESSEIEFYEETIQSIENEQHDIEIKYSEAKTDIEKQNLLSILNSINNVIEKINHQISLLS